MSSSSLKLKIALRNVLRNRRRTALNVLIIGASIAAIVVFKGFGFYMIDRLREVTINSQFGHAQIASEKTWNLSADDSPKDRLISLDPAVFKQIESLPEVEYVSPRLSYYSLIGFGNQSVGAWGFAFDPARETRMTRTMKIIEGRALSPDSRFEIIIGSGLVKQFKAKVGSSVTLISHTMDGSVNAVDSEVVGIFQTGLQEIDNLSFFLGMSTAQRLLDTESVERYIVLLKNTEDTDRVAATIASILPKGIGIRAWHELAQTYRQVSRFFTAQNLIVQWILMVLALLATANTVAMSISERTGEIGTVRALGDSRFEIVSQFILEGLILGLIGGVGGCVLGFLSAVFIDSLRIPIYPPGISVAVLVEVYFLPLAYLQAILMTCGITVLATVVPAMAATRMKIVDALKRNI